MTQLELDILEKLQSVRTPFLDFLVPKISFLGNAGIIWIVTAIILVLFKKTRKCGIAIGMTLFICLVLDNILLKNIIARDRPFIVDETIKLLIPKPSDYSFPSGHTLSCFACASVVMHYHRKFLGWISLVFAFVIGFTRLYLRVHFPTDVLGGMIIGVIFGISGIFATEFIYKKISAKRGQKE